MNQPTIRLKCRDCSTEFDFPYSLSAMALNDRIIYPKHCRRCHCIRASLPRETYQLEYPGRDGRRIPQEYNPCWHENIYEFTEFFVYILSMTGPQTIEFYVGHTKNIHTRVQSHVNGWDDRTKGTNPKLVWFCEVATREEATRLEAELKGVNEQNSDIIKEMVLSFKHLASQLDYTAL